MYYTLATEQVLQKLNASAKNGLSSAAADKLLAELGPNQLAEIKVESLLSKLIRQFTDALVLILIAAAVVSFAVGETLDASVIIAIVLINGLMGYVQEARAEKAIDALKQLSTDYAKVLRNGTVTTVAVANLVPGDIILVESGDKIPADARLIEAANLEITESILTGESKTVTKNAETVLTQEDIPLGDRINMLYKDTSVVYGRGTAVVTQTGSQTEIGKISTLLQQQDQVDTPLSKELNVVGKRLSAAALLIIVVIFILGIRIDGLELKEAFITAISLAVAAIPEGLPAVVTISLAIGVSRLAKQRAIIRRLQAVETLGSTNYILTDKTGTLTQNKMKVSNVEPDTNNQQLLLAITLCNDAQGNVGDSTETALIEFAEHSGINVAQVRETYKRVFEIPFSSDTKKMEVVVRDPSDPNKLTVYTKGAPEVIAEMVTEDTQKVLDLNNKYAQQGLRSLAVSFKEITPEELENAKNSENPENILSTYHQFLGIVAQKDPLRPQVKEALLTARRAGVETIMITGDHKLTATNIAKELELITAEDQVMDGRELGEITGSELAEILKEVRVFARVSPQQKLNIVEAVKSTGAITAVTGDGVNDAPAIKTADIGISMGITGTDVSKEVSDMILQDDNYATIVEAIQQGRIVYDNLVKFITYLISCNISEILVVTAAIITKLPLPLLPIQILWINLVTDGFPALALGLEPGEKDIMLRQPRRQGHLLSKHRWVRMVFQALLMAGGTFFVFYKGLGMSVSIAQTAALVTLAFAQLFHSINSRSEAHSLFSPKLAFNKYIYLTFALSAALQLAIVYMPLGNIIFKTTPLPANVLLLSIALSLIAVLGTELYKLSLHYKHARIS